MKTRALFPLVALSALVTLGASDCDTKPSSDDIQRQQQERILQESTSQIGMPAMKNFRERKLLKDIIEMRDQTGLVTHTYFYSDINGKIGDKLCDSIGYPIPYATQFTNPQKMEYYSGHGMAQLPQADPNGLFSPGSAEGTWVLCKDPKGSEVRPVYVEPRVIASPFPLR